MQTACNIIVMTIVGYVRYRVVLGNNLAIVSNTVSSQFGTFFYLHTYYHD